MTRIRALAAMVLALLCAAPSAAATKTDAQLYYLPAGQVDLTQLLAPPPDPNSALQQYDEKKMQEVMAARTPSDIAEAKADAKRNVFVFADVLGDKFTATNLPLTAALFKHANLDTEILIDDAKAVFGRPRPGGAPETHPSYPSGHAAFAACTAILLSEMVPERRADIFGRAGVFAEGRIIAGVHYPSDVEAGWISGTVIAAAFLKNQRFQVDFQAARDELRRTLGLPL